MSFAHVLDGNNVFGLSIAARLTLAPFTLAEIKHLRCDRSITVSRTFADSQNGVFLSAKAGAIVERMA